MVFFKPLGITLLVWPTYALPQSFFVSLYIQFRRYFAIIVFKFFEGCLRLYCLELLVLKAVFKLIYLNTLVMKVSLYVLKILIFAYGYYC
jgi:hypothetical protein